MFTATRSTIAFVLLGAGLLVWGLVVVAIGHQQGQGWSLTSLGAVLIGVSGAGTRARGRC